MSESPSTPEFPEIVQARPAATAVPPLTYAAFPPVAVEPAPLPRGDAAMDAVWALTGLFAAFMGILFVQARELWEPSPEWAIAVQAGWNGGISLTVVALLLARRRQGGRAIGLGRAPLGPTLGWGILAIPACYIINIGILACYAALLFLQGQSFEQMAAGKLHVIGAIAETPPLLIVPLTAFVGLYEEVLFRGLILTRLRDALRSPIAAALVSSLLFAACHFSMGPLGMIQAGGIGLVFSLLAVWRRSLWPCIVAHFLLDALAFFLAYFLQPLLPNGL